MEMLPIIQIVPEMNLALDPVSGVLGASLGQGVVILSLDDVNEEVARVEQAADELMESLNPNTSPLGAYEGREGSYLTAGMLTNAAYGFIIALLIIFAALPLLIKLGVF